MRMITLEYIWIITCAPNSCVVELKINKAEVLCVGCNFTVSAKVLMQHSFVEANLQKEAENNFACDGHNLLYISQAVGFCNEI